MLRHFALLLLFCFLPALAAQAQPDGPPPGMFFGPLSARTATSISIDEFSGYSNQVVTHTFTVSAETSVFGCTLDDVRLGTMTMVQFDADAAGQSATVIEFQGCAPTIHLQGTVEAVDATSFRLGGVVDATGSVGTATIMVDASTMYVRCNGEQASFERLVVGAAVAVEATEGTTTGYLATGIYLLNDCPEVLHVTGRFIALDATSLTMEIDNEGEATLPFFSPDPQVPGDSSLVALMSCVGLPTSWSTLTAGEALAAVVITDAGGPRQIQWAMTMKDCPLPFDGTIVAVDGASLTVRGLDGVEHTYVFGDMTQLASCTAEPLAIGDLKVGMVVSGQWQIIDGRDVVLFCTVMNDCPQPLGVYGTVSSVGDGRLTVTEFYSGRVVDVTYSDFTPVMNCVGMISRADRILSGDTVAVSYHTETVGNVADAIQHLSPCDIQPIYGEITARTSTSITVRMADGTERTFTIGDGTKLVDCSGQELVDDIDINVVGQMAEGYADGSGTILHAFISVGCPEYTVVSGVVTSMTATSVTVATTTESVTASIGQHTFVTDDHGMVLNGEPLAAGTQVCMVVGVLGNETSAIQIIVGACESLGIPTELTTTGTVTGIDESVVSVEHGNTTSAFAVGGVTTITLADGRTGSVGDLVVGDRVAVRSERRTPDGRPVASTIAVSGSATTSVGSDIDRASTVVVAPNPGRDVVRVDLGTQTVGSITVLDLTGSAVLTTTSTNVDVRTLATGTYRLVITDAAGNQRTAPLQIVR